MSRRLLALSGFGVIGVVFHHAVHWVLTGMFWWTDRYILSASVPDFSQLGSVSYWVIRGLDQFFVISVPIFLLTTGFFAAGTIGRVNAKHDWQTVFNRLRVLLIPYFIWTAVYVVMRYVLGERFSPADLLSILISGTATIPFYYVPLLVILYLLAPFLVRMAKSHWQILLAIMLVCQVIVVVAAYQAFFTDIPGSSRVYAYLRGTHVFDLGLWFVLGIILKLHLPSIKIFMARIQPVLWPVTGVIAVVAIFEWEFIRRISGKEWIGTDLTVFDKIFALMLVMTILFHIKMVLPAPRQLGALGSKIYGVYLSHMLILSIVAKLVYRFTPGLLAFPLAFWMILGLLGMFVPLLTMRFMKVSPLRRYYVTIFG